MGERKLCYGCFEMKQAYEPVCKHCGYAEGTEYNPNYMAPGTLLSDERYVVGVLLGYNSEGATYIGYNSSIGCKVLIREYMPEGLCTRVKGKATISVNPSHVVQYKALMAEFTELNKALAKMRNLPHISPTLDLFAVNNTTYAVYEYLDGVKLVDYLKENAGDLSWKQVSEMFPTFFTSLSLMHNNSILHRAISPDTIYVSEKNELRLCGFSISPVRTVHSELPCEIFHGYAAPEQYSPSARQGTFTDVYSICAVLYRILTGCKPTDAPSRMQNDNLCSPHEMNPSIPRHVSDVIMRGMNLFGNDRIQTVTELVTQLFEQKVEPETTVMKTPPPTTHTYQFNRHEMEQQYTDKRDHGEYRDYNVDSQDNVIDRIKIPIIIGVLLTCVLLVIAIVALSLLDMGPFAGKGGNSGHKEIQASDITESVNNVVTESVSETLVGDSTMPTLIGKDYESKKALFEADNWLHLEGEYEYNEDFAAGLIFYQSIDPGTPFTSGATVKVKVSKGPSFAYIPEFSGKYLSDYEDLLREVGITNYTTEAVVNYNYSSGMVIELSKEPGEIFDLTGTETLKIYYASNPESNDDPDEPDEPNEPDKPDEPDTPTPTSPPEPENPNPPDEPDVPDTPVETYVDNEVPNIGEE